MTTNLNWFIQSGNPELLGYTRATSTGFSHADCPQMFSHNPGAGSENPQRMQRLQPSPKIESVWMSIKLGLAACASTLPSSIRTISTDDFKPWPPRIIE